MAHFDSERNAVAFELFEKQSTRMKIYIAIVAVAIVAVYFGLRVFLRRGVRASLKKLFGKSYNEKTAYIGPSQGIAVDVISRRFAYVGADDKAIFDSIEITNLRLEKTEDALERGGNLTIMTMRPGLELLKVEAPDSVDQLEKVEALLRAILR